LRGAAFVLLNVLAAAANAQFSGTLSVVSDYRYRGITLSDQKPAAQVGLTYDDPTGWYAGAFGSTVRLAPPAGPNFQALGFAGYAVRLPSGVSLEAGGDYSAFTGASRYNYGEIFLGAAADAVSGRIYYSPRYFGQHGDGVYAELNASQPLIDRIRVFAHVGYLRASYPTGYRQWSKQNTIDGRVGVGIEFDWFHLDLAWVGLNATYAAYQITGTNSPNTVVLTLTRSF
jgi:uncharacterized protein (TIGR02001 family)